MGNTKLSDAAQNIMTKPSFTTTHVLARGDVLPAAKKTLGVDDIPNNDLLPHLFTTGTGSGSFYDLVLERGDIIFPKSQAANDWFPTEEGKQRAAETQEGAPLCEVRGGKKVFAEITPPPAIIHSWPRPSYFEICMVMADHSVVVIKKKKRGVG